MSSGLASHLRDLEQEARDAEKDVEDFRDELHRKTIAFNTEINELVYRVQRDKAALREQLEKKQTIAKQKNDEVQAFRVRTFTTLKPNQGLFLYSKTFFWDFRIRSKAQTTLESLRALAPRR
jgi:hypothetical protein